MCCSAFFFVKFVQFKQYCIIISHKRRSIPRLHDYNRFTRLVKKIMLHIPLRDEKGEIDFSLVFFPRQPFIKFAFRPASKG